MNAQQRVQTAYAHLINRGLEPMKAAAIVGHLIEESGAFDPNVISGERRGDNGTAAYAPQLRGDRLQNYERYVAERGLNAGDLGNQLDFVLHEGRSGLDAGAARAMKQLDSSTNLRDATAAFSHYERPAGYTLKNPYGIDTFDKRLGHAQKTYGMFGQQQGQPAPQGQPSYPRPEQQASAVSQPYNLSPYLVSPDRQGHLDGIDDSFRNQLGQMVQSAPPEIRSEIKLLSGFRSEDRQRQLFDAAVKKYGSVAAARKWVAPPGKSQHNHGSAYDLRYGSDEAKKWVHANAEKFGLQFPMAHEPWHIEPMGARAKDGKRSPATSQAGGRGNPSNPSPPSGVYGLPATQSDQSTMPNNGYVPKNPLGDRPFQTAQMPASTFRAANYAPPPQDLVDPLGLYQ